MHGTVVMLMALSGLGCHYKHADVTYAPSCYSSSCYSSVGCYSSTSYGCYSAGYASVVEPSCYSACYSSDYSGCYGGYQASCYGGCYGGGGHGWKRGHGCGLFANLFSCFGHKRRAYNNCNECDYAVVDSGCYSESYAPAVFGSPMPIYETPYATSQGMYAAPAASTVRPSDAANVQTSVPAEAKPAPANPAAQPAAPAEMEDDATATPPPPPTPADALKEVAPAPAPAADALKAVTPAPAAETVTP